MQRDTDRVSSGHTEKTTCEENVGRSGLKLLLSRGLKTRMCLEDLRGDQGAGWLGVRQGEEQVDDYTMMVWGGTVCSCAGCWKAMRLSTQDGKQ